MPRLQYLALAFVPLAAAAAPDLPAPGEQGGTPPASIRTVQYQAVTGPVYVPDVVGETITLDKWHQPASVPTRRLRRLDGLTVAPVFVPDVTVVAPTLSWRGVYADRVPGRKPLVPEGRVVAPVFVPDVTQPVPGLSWSPVYPVPTRRIVRPVGASAFQWVDEAVAPTVTPLSWAPRYVDPVRRQRLAQVAGAVMPPRRVGFQAQWAAGSNVLLTRKQV
jgi:hypothetical protein